MSERGLILALGGGGVRGFAHLGVLQVLQEQGLPIAGLVGTSMGAVVAALYGAGCSLHMLCEFAATFAWEELFDLSLHALGMSSGSRILAVLDLLTKGRTFAELNLPVWAVATDLDTGEPVVLREGPVAPAVRASVSVPGALAPYTFQGRTFVDGAVVAGVPVEIAHEMGRPVVAVDVGFGFQPGRVRNVLGVLAKVVQIMGNELDRRQVDQADLLIRPAVGGIPSTHFDQAEACVECGRRAAAEALPAIRGLIEAGAVS